MDMMLMKKNFTKKILIFISICAFFGIFNTEVYAQEQVLKIGLTAGFSGALSSMARPARNGTLVCADDYNEKGGIEVGGKRYKIDMVLCDTFTNPTTGVGCTHKFADTGLKFMIGPLASSVTLAVKPITEERKLLVVTTSMSVKILNPPNELIVRNAFNTEHVAQLLVPYIKENLNIERVALITRNQAWGLGNSELFAREFKKHGIEVVANEIFEPDAKDFFTPLTKIKSKNPQGLLLSAYPEEGGLIIKQMATLGMPIRTFCQNTPAGGKAFFEIGKENVERHLSLLPPDPNCEKPKAAAFRKKYIEKYGEEPVSVQAPMWYDSLYCLLEAIKLAQSVDDVWKVREAFNSLDLEGSNWRMRFWPNGQLIPQASITKFNKKGEREVVALVGMEPDGSIYVREVKK